MQNCRPKINYYLDIKVMYKKCIMLMVPSSHFYLLFIFKPRTSTMQPILRKPPFIFLKEYEQPPRNTGEEICEEIKFENAKIEENSYYNTTNLKLRCSKK